MKSRNAIARFYDAVAAALAVSIAREGMHRASNRDLRTLGIDPARFNEINR